MLIKTSWLVATRPLFWKMGLSVMPVAESSSFQNNVLNQSWRVSPQVLSPLILPLKRYKTTLWNVKLLSAVNSDAWL